MERKFAPYLLKHIKFIRNYRKPLSVWYPVFFIACKTLILLHGLQRLTVSFSLVWFLCHDCKIFGWFYAFNNFWKSSSYSLVNLIINLVRLLTFEFSDCEFQSYLKKGNCTILLLFEKSNDFALTLTSSNIATFIWLHISF